MVMQTSKNKCGVDNSALQQQRWLRLAQVNSKLIDLAQVCVCVLARSKYKQVQSKSCALLMQASSIHQILIN